MNLIVFFFWIAALIATTFLVYSIINHKKLDLRWNHPRILVESFLLLIFVLMGWIFMT